MISEKNAMKREVCGDCGVKEGQLHVSGCDMECCASCGGQSTWCECPSSTSTKERVPFILYPNLCAKCGTLWPEMFMVPMKNGSGILSLGCGKRCCARHATRKSRNGLTVRLWTNAPCRNLTCSDTVNRTRAKDATMLMLDRDLKGVQTARNLSPVA